MPRVLEVDPTHELRLRHTACGALIGYFRHEVINDGIYTYHGGATEQRYYIICPNCGQKAYTNGHRALLDGY